MKLYHFSDRGDINVFVPRAPLKHPHSEPLVYAMSEIESPLYFFPRDCPRISTWVTAQTSPSDREEFYTNGPARIKSYIDRSSEEAWRTGSVYRYTFDSEGFEAGHGYGDWVSRKTQYPIEVVLIDDLPGAAESGGMSVQVVDSLAELGRLVHDYETMQWTTTLHVSMVRMSLLPGWEHTQTKPVWSPT